MFRRYSRLLSAPLSKGHIQIISNSKFSLRTSQDVSLQQVSTEHSLPFDRSFTNFNSFLLFQVQITNWHFSVNLTVMYRYRVYRFSALNGGNITWSYPLLFRFSAPFSWGFQEDIKKTKFSWVTNIFFSPNTNMNNIRFTSFERIWIWILFEFWKNIRIHSNIIKYLNIHI